MVTMKMANRAFIITITSLVHYSLTLFYPRRPLTIASSRLWLRNRRNNNNTDNKNRRLDKEEEHDDCGG